MIRTWLYIIAGIVSVLIGWNISQFLVNDLHLLEEQEELIIFPLVTIFLAVGMVMNELFMSNPTRLKLNFRIAKIPFFVAIAIGLIAGLLAGGIALLALESSISDWFMRILSWLLVGFAVGLAEGLTWQFYSQEAGDRKRYLLRLRNSIMGASVASIVAALFFEFIRFFESPRSIEEPLGFSILGLILGLTFSLTNSPSYMAALRAGRGFEYTDSIYPDIDPRMTVKSQPYPIKRKSLKFVSQSTSQTDEKIEEGLSIQLPATGKIKIGSAIKAEICIPGLPLHAADIVVTQRDAILDPNPKHFDTIEVNGRRLINNNDVPLKHNYLITFYTQNSNDEKIYRFVYYNRFLDPQA